MGCGPDHAQGDGGGTMSERVLGLSVFAWQDLPEPDREAARHG